MRVSLSSAVPAGVLAATPAAASTLSDPTRYLIPPLTIVGDSVIDGLDANGATPGTQGFCNAPAGVRSRVDRAEGPLRGFAETAGGATGTVSASGFGDIVSVDAGDVHPRRR